MHARLFDFYVLTIMMDTLILAHWDFGQGNGKGENYDTDRELPRLASLRLLSLVSLFLVCNHFVVYCLLILSFFEFSCCSLFVVAHTSNHSAFHYGAFGVCGVEEFEAGRRPLHLFVYSCLRVS